MSEEFNPLSQSARKKYTGKLPKRKGWWRSLSKTRRTFIVGAILLQIPFAFFVVLPRYQFNADMKEQEERIAKILSRTGLDCTDVFSAIRLKRRDLLDMDHPKCYRCSRFYRDEVDGLKRQPFSLKKWITRPYECFTEASMLFVALGGMTTLLSYPIVKYTRMSGIVSHAFQLSLIGFTLGFPIYTFLNCDGKNMIIKTVKVETQSNGDPTYWVRQSYDYKDNAPDQFELKLDYQNLKQYQHFEDEDDELDHELNSEEAL